LKLINKYKNLELIISDELLQKLGEIGIKQYPKEFGGFLIGYYSDNLKTLTIINYLLPKKYRSLSFIFERSIEGIKEVFDNLFKAKRHYYVGEWHTHPNGSTMYSQTDLKAMTEIEKCETVKINNPVLLILSIDRENIIDTGFYLYNNKKLIPYGKN